MSGFHSGSSSNSSSSSSSSSSSIHLITPRVLENRLITERDGSLDIFTNFETFLSQWVKFLTRNGKPTTESNPGFEVIRRNAGQLYIPLFGKYRNLLLINSRGDGHCFNNSLFIFTSMINTKISDSKFLQLIVRAELELDDFNITIENFISSQLVLADKYIESKNMVPIKTEQDKMEIRDPNTPEIYPFLHNYSNIFNCNVLVISVDTNTYKIESKTYENPTSPNSETEHVVIIQKGRSHFQVLILHDSTGEQRKQLYHDVFNFTRDLLGY